MIHYLRTRLWRLLTTSYCPDPTFRTFATRSQTQVDKNARVTVAVLDAHEAAKFFGVPLARCGIQPVYLHIENRSDKLVRLQLVRIDPNYYTPSEASKLSNEISYSEAGITTRETRDLWDMPVIFLLILAFRASEWLLRRKWGVV